MFFLFKRFEARKEWILIIFKFGHSRGNNPVSTHCLFFIGSSHERLRFVRSQKLYGFMLRLRDFALLSLRIFSKSLLPWGQECSTLLRQNVCSSKNNDKNYCKAVRLSYKELP